MSLTMQDAVCRHFNTPENYLDSAFYIRIRAELVREMCGTIENAEILDVGCGDGLVSSQFLGGGNRLTLIDTAEKMLAVAKARIESIHPRTDIGSVAYLHGDILNAPIEGPFDYIFALGVMAHIGSPRKLFGRLERLLKPSGSLLLQFTDYSLPLSKLLWAYDAAKETLWGRRGYIFQRTRSADVQKIAGEFGFQTQAACRHSFNPPGLRYLLSDERLYGLQKRALQQPLLHLLTTDYLLKLVKV